MSWYNMQSWGPLMHAWLKQNASLKHTVRDCSLGSFQAVVTPHLVQMYTGSVAWKHTQQDKTQKERRKRD